MGLYPESLAGQHGKSGSVLALIGTPGTKLFGTTPLNGPVRCLTAGDNRLFAVAGGTVYEVFDTSTSVPPVSYGFVQNSVSPAQMFLNGGQIFVTSGGQGYITLSTGTTPVVAASTGTFMDGYFIAAVPNSNQFQLSNLNNGFIWDPLDVGVKQGYADAISVILAAFEQLWIFGFDTTEVWYDSGAANFPFQRIPGGLIEYGCFAPFSARVVENSIMWLGGASFSGRGVVYQTNGLIPTRVSNHALEYQIQNVYPNIQDAVAFSYQDSGHSFYVIHFPSATAEPGGPAIGATWAYDITTGMWHERGFWNESTGQYNASLGRFHAFTFNKHIVGDYRNGNLYEQNLNFYTDNGNPIRRLRSSPHITDKMLWTRYNQLLLDMSTGDAPQGLVPEMMLRWSDNGGRTWSNEKWATSGPTGKYTTRVIWRRLGRSRDRAFEISSTSAIEQVWVSSYLNFDNGSGA
jgi:hypothetical protein